MLLRGRTHIICEVINWISRRIVILRNCLDLIIWAILAPSRIEIMFFIVFLFLLRDDVFIIVLFIHILLLNYFFSFFLSNVVTICLLLEEILLLVNINDITVHYLFICLLKLYLNKYAINNTFFIISWLGSILKLASTYITLSISFSMSSLHTNSPS
jgi:hypothetical protein